MAGKHKGKSHEKKIAKFKGRHPEGRKVYSHKRRGHNCHWARGEYK